MLMACWWRRSSETTLGVQVLVLNRAREVGGGQTRGSLPGSIAGRILVYPKVHEKPFEHFSQEMILCFTESKIIDDIIYFPLRKNKCCQIKHGTMLIT